MRTYRNERRKPGAAFGTWRSTEKQQGRLAPSLAAWGVEQLFRFPGQLVPIPETVLEEDIGSEACGFGNCGGRPG
jgi:hypothetical protein